MKTKKIPRVVKAWLGLLGFYGGMLATLIVGCINVFNPSLGFNAFVIMLASSVVLGLYLSERRRETLVEWKVLKPKKKERS